MSWIRNTWKNIDKKRGSSWCRGWRWTWGGWGRSWRWRGWWTSILATIKREEHFEEYLESWTEPLNSCIWKSDTERERSQTESIILWRGKVFLYLWGGCTVHRCQRLEHRPLLASSPAWLEERGTGSCFLMFCDESLKVLVVVATAMAELLSWSYYQLLRGNLTVLGWKQSLCTTQLYWVKTF